MILWLETFETRTDALRFVRDHTDHTVFQDGPHWIAVNPTGRRVFRLVDTANDVHWKEMERQ